MTVAWDLSPKTTGFRRVKRLIFAADLTNRGVKIVTGAKDASRSWLATQGMNFQSKLESIEDTSIKEENMSTHTLKRRTVLRGAALLALFLAGCQKKDESAPRPQASEP